MNKRTALVYIALDRLTVSAVVGEQIGDTMSVNRNNNFVELKATLSEAVYLKILSGGALNVM